MNQFPRMHRLPPYVFAVVGDLNMQMHRQNIDIVDMGIGTLICPPRNSSWTNSWKPPARP
jgi:hypothetical protein